MPAVHKHTQNTCTQYKYTQSDTGRRGSKYTQTDLDSHPYKHQHTRTNTRVRRVYMPPLLGGLARGIESDQE